MSDDRAPGLTELIYLPEPTWQPALIAAGIAGVLVGISSWWPYAAAGAVVAVIALGAWIRDAGRGFGRLPRHQRVTSAPIVPTRVRGSRRT